jgi:tryptophanyl-tRNA synthetase
MKGKRVLSGIRATGRLHIGNYFGAVKGMLELQNNPEYETFYMVADVHTITTPYHVEELKKNRREVVIDYLAAGLDPKKSVIFLQSDVPEHLELAFYLSSVVTIARMQHLPTYKDKIKQYPKDNSMALLNYPVLMAADILAYKADFVPVGIDQEPHLEVAREIARKMNDKYKTGFPEPQRFKTKGEYVPSLKGEGKMSKTVEGSYIDLTDDFETIKRKIAKIPTDSGTDMDEVRKGSLYVLYKAIFPEEFDEVFNKNYIGGRARYDAIKDKFLKSLFDYLKPVQEKRAEIERDTSYVEKVIKESATKARDVAQQTVSEVKKAMGLD